MQMWIKCINHLTINTFLKYTVFMIKEEKIKSIRIAQEAHYQIRMLAFKRNIPLKTLIEELITKELKKNG